MDDRFPAVWQRVSGALHSSAPDELRQLILLKYASCCSYRALPCSPSCRELSCLFARLAREEFGHLRRLRAVFFLLTGEQLRFSGKTPPHFQSSEPLSLLREAYRLETELSELQLSHKSSAASAVLGSIANADAAHAAQIAELTSRLI